MNKKANKSITADLTNISEVDLLQAVVDITTRNTQLTEDDERELYAINEELKRRDALSFLPNEIKAYNQKLHKAR